MVCGRLTSTVKPDGNTGIGFTYDEKGNVSSEYDGRGNTAQYFYTNNRVTEKIKKDGNRIYYTYNACGELESEEDACGNVTEYTYDLCGRLKKVTMPEGVTAEYTYDYAGSILTQTDGEGQW